jgi:NAD-dependent dihydropyrimidine dehydrogenase PreA subunit
MIEGIEGALCIGCKLCENVCQMDVLRWEGNSIRILYPDDCCNCMECLFVCPTEAIILNTTVHQKFDARMRWNQIKSALSPKVRI